MSYAEVLLNQPVVIDNGSGTIKAGIAGEDVPKTIFSSYVGRPKHTRVMAGAVEGDHFIGPKAVDLRGLLKLNYPIEHGVVTDWDDMEKIWQYLYADGLKTVPEEHPVLLTEAPLNPRQHREKAAQIFFETFNVPAMFVSIQAVLALYASGRTTGLVLDSGDGVTHAVPVYDGFAVNSGIRRIDVAGRDITDHLHLLLRKRGINFTTTAEKEIVKQIKERMCFIVPNPAQAEKDFAHRTEEYVLPDGKSIKLAQEAFRAPEVLFNPDIIGLEGVGIHDMLLEAINKTDLDLRRTLYANILLSGGTTLCKGFGERLLSEMKKSAYKDMKIKIFAPPERKYSTWMGGSILASLGTFKKMWITAEEYQEGSSRLHNTF